MDHEGLVHHQPGGLRGLASAAVWTRGCAVGIQDYRQLLNRGSDSGISYQQFDVAMSRGPGDAEGETNRELGKHPRTARYRLILQLGGHMHRPWLSVDDRRRPMRRARRGHGRRGRTWLKRGSDGHQLDRRVGQSRAATCLVGKLPQAARQGATAVW
jgi:hypothetical protein